MMNDLTSTLNSLAAAWLPAIGRASLHGGIFVAVVWAVCRAFRSLPASVRYWLWWIACAQWMIRLLLVSPIALPLLPAEPESVEPIAFETAAPISRQPAGIVSVSSQTSQMVAASSSPGLALTFEGGALVLWGLAMVSLSAFSLRKFAHTRMIVVRAPRLDDGVSVHRAAQQIADELGIRIPVLRESEDVRCPMLTGWFRPTILLPHGFAEEGPEEIVRLALAHEMAHIRRRDLWFGVVPAISQLLLFFHPLAWVAAHEAAAAREESCDIEALRVGGGTPATYARLLLDTAQANSYGAALGAAFGYRLLHRRIKMLNRSLRLDSVRTRRAASLLILGSALGSLPWTVTGQTPGSQAYPAPKTSAKAAPKTSKPTKTTAAKASRPAPKTVKGTLFASTKAVSVSGVAALTTAKGITTATTKGQNPFAATAVSGSFNGKAAGTGTSFSGSTVGGTFNGSVSRAGSAGKGAAVGGGVFSGNAVQGGAAFSGSVAGQSTTGTAKPIAQPGSTFGGGGFGGGSSSAPTSAAASPAFGGGGFGGGASLNPTIAETSDGFGAAAANPGHLVSVQFKDLDLRSALSKMFHAAGVNYVIGSGVRADSVTCELTDRPLAEALAAMLRGVEQQLTYRIEGDVYYVVPK